MDIKCKNCNNTFHEEIQVRGFIYHTGTCCPKCGRDIELFVSEIGKVKVRTCGIDKDYE